MHVHVLLPLSHVFVYISLEVYTLTKLYMFIKYFKSSKTTKSFFCLPYDADGRKHSCMYCIFHDCTSLWYNNYCFTFPM